LFVILWIFLNTAFKSAVRPSAADAVG